MEAGELCNREVVICHPETSLIRAAQLMREHHVGCLVVVEPGDDNEPVGMITDRDVVIDGVAVQPDRLSALAVSRVMTCELVTVLETEDVATVLSRMTAFGVRRVPVVDDARSLQGILAYDDLIEWIAEELGDLIRVVRNELQLEERRLGGEIHAR